MSVRKVTVRKVVAWALFIVLVLPVMLGVAAWLVFYTLLSAFAPDRTNGRIVSQGEEREYLLHVPRRYDAARPAPLVVSLHGAMNWPAFQGEVSRWNTLADEHGFLVVYPAGEGFGPKAWFMRGARQPATMPDVVFIADLLAKLQAEYRIDPARIYVNGLSNGGGMAFVVSCTLSDRIAAIGAVAAAQSLPWTWCKDERPIPMIAFHGTQDTIVPYQGGKVAIAPLPFPSVPGWAAQWARRNGCKARSESVPARDVTRLEYTGCAEHASVVLYTLEGAGHQWFGGRAMPEWMVGPMSNQVDATRTMWEFFSRHRLPDRTAVAVGH